MSTIKHIPTSNLVYSSFAAFTCDDQPEIAGRWFSKTLIVLGHSLPSVRQTLYRMSKEKELTARKEGRNKYYSMSQYARAEITTGLDLMFSGAKKEWSGLWTLVNYSFPDSKRIDRDRVRTLLNTMGFRQLSNGLYVHPNANDALLTSTVQEMGVGDHVFIFSASSVGDDKQDQVVSSLWNFDELNVQYKQFLEIFSPLEDSIKHYSEQELFVIRYALVISYLKIAWSDPMQSERFLPADWQGGHAQKLTAELYKAILPSATAYAQAMGLGHHDK